MHSACVPCLPKQITFGSALICPSCSEVTPPPPAGQTQFQALPDSVLENETLSTSREVTPNCEDFVADEKAISTYVECKKNYCHDHAAAHPKSQATYSHKLEKLGANRTANQAKEPAAENCPLHPTKILRSFCSHCSDLLCHQREVIHPSQHIASLSLKLLLTQNLH